jgi:hypothetical protein
MSVFATPSAILPTTEHSVLSAVLVQRLTWTLPIEDLALLYEHAIKRVSSKGSKVFNCEFTYPTRPVLKSSFAWPKLCVLFGDTIGADFPSVHQCSGTRQPDDLGT